MNAATLVIHGLSAISVYSVTVVVRLMAFTSGLVALLGGRNGAPFLPIRDWEYYVIGLPRGTSSADAG